MTVIVALHHVTDALIHTLDQATPAPLEVGDGEAPGKAGEDAPAQYLIVEVIPGGGPVGGGASDPTSAAQIVYQVTAVARRRWEADRAARLARQAILGRTAGGGYAHPIDAYTVNGGPKSLDVDDGLAVWARTFDSAGGHLIEGRTHNVADRYVLHVTPA